MIPITLPVAELKSALTGLGKVIPSKSNLAVLQHVKVERTPEGWIALTTTDLDRFATMRLEHPAEGPPLAVLVPFDTLAQLAKTCPKEEKILIEASPEGPLLRFSLANNLGVQKVKLLPVAEFPQTPRIKCEPISLPPDMRSAINEAMSCTSTDQTRYILNGTFIDASSPKTQYVVGTDGRHLYCANSFRLPLKHSVLIPGHKFLEWKEFHQDGEWQLRADPTHIQLSTRRWRFISRQIEGKYPDWRVPIPNPAEARTHVSIEPGKLDALLKLIQRLPCHDERFRSIGLQTKGNCLHLLAKATNDEPWLEVPVQTNKVEGPDMTLFLDRRFLVKALQFGLTTISLVDPVSAVRFHEKGRQLIVMPVRPESAQSQPPPTRPKPAPVSPKTPAPPNTPMINSPTPEAPPTGNPQLTPMDEAIQTTLQIRDKFNEGFDLLRDLSLKLKNIGREQRASAREMHSIRTTLRSLQGLKL